MPLYHYRCTACQHEFEQLVHTRDGAVVTAVACPACHSEASERMLTSFNVGNRGASQSAPSEMPFCGRCGENRPPCSN
jgi:putative FmdB family regulatory protein